MSGGGCIPCICSSMGSPSVRGGRRRLLYQSGSSTAGRHRSSQNDCRSSGPRSVTVHPKRVTDRQNGNFHL